MLKSFTYFVSSIPMLHFGAKPPFSFDNFLSLSRRFISTKDIDTISIILNPPGYVNDKMPLILKEWYSFDTALRNALVKIRASRKHVDSLLYLRKDSYRGVSLDSLAMAAHRAVSVIDAEKTLDRYRWQFLDELVRGHYFDLEFLIVYGIKLLILERWEKINSADKPKLLEEILVDTAGLNV